MADGEGHYSRDCQRLTNYLQSQQPRTGEFWSVDLHEAPHGWLGFAAHVLGPHLGNVRFRAWLDCGDFIIQGLKGLFTGGLGAWGVCLEEEGCHTRGLASSQPDALRIFTLLQSQLRTPDVKVQCTGRPLCHCYRAALQGTWCYFHLPALVKVVAQVMGQDRHPASWWKECQNSEVMLGH